MQIKVDATMYDCTKIKEIQPGDNNINILIIVAQLIIQLN